MSADRDRLARLALAMLTEPGDARMSGLVASLGAPQVLDSLTAERTPTDGLLTLPAARLREVRPERELERADRAGLRFVVPGDAEWPRCLDDLESAPVVNDRGGTPLGLWIRGPLRLDHLLDSVAVVGSRSATTYGADLAAGIAAECGRAGTATVSGAAFGIDQAAHRGALAVDAPTVAVLACGADRVYPAAHQQLIEHLARECAVVSETPPGGAPMRMRFLARNRIIAALTRGTVVVEAALRSGALNTANWAGHLNRTLMGVPGPVTSAASAGVHQLIRTGAATLVTSGSEVLELVGAAGEHLLEVPRGRERPRDALSRRLHQVLEAVPSRSGAGPDSIARTAGLGLVEVQSALMTLEAADMVERTPAGWSLADRARD